MLCTWNVSKQFGLPGSYQQYVIKWIEDAKTETTLTKRIAMAVNALSRGFGFARMLRQT